MVALFLADGFEEVEALTPLDYLRRAGIDVYSVGVTGKLVKGAHNIIVTADQTIEEVRLPDIQMIILPGGGLGTKNLEKNASMKNIIDYAAKHASVAAICAAPSILGHMGLLEGKQAVCYPGFEKELTGAKVLSQPTVVDGNLITAQGAGAAQQFAFAIISYLLGDEKAEQIMEQVVWK